MHWQYLTVSEKKFKILRI